MIRCRADEEWFWKARFRGAYCRDDFAATFYDDAEHRNCIPLKLKYRRRDKTAVPSNGMPFFFRSGITVLYPRLSRSSHYVHQ